MNFKYINYNSCQLRTKLLSSFWETIGESMSFSFNIKESIDLIDVLFWGNRFLKVSNITINDSLIEKMLQKVYMRKHCIDQYNRLNLEEKKNSYIILNELSST